MRKNIAALFLLAALACSLFFFTVDVAYAVPESDVFTTAEDTKVAEAAPDTAYGGAATTSVTTNTAGDVRTYLMFDTSSVPDAARELTATLVFNVSSVAGSTTAYNFTSFASAWDEATLTWNTQPATVTHTLSVSHAATDGNWSIDVTDLFIDSATFTIRIQYTTEGAAVPTTIDIDSKEGAQDPELTVTYDEGDYKYTFHGVYDETTGAAVANCTATAYFDGAPAETFTVTTDTPIWFLEIPEYVSFDLGTFTREFWFDGSENNTDIYVHNDTFTLYIINFMDYTAVMEDYQFVTASVNVNGTLVIAEKRKIDVQSSVAMSLVEGRKYQIMISDSDGNTYTYGDLLMTSTAAVQLTLRGVDFPKESLLTQKNVHIYATRTHGSPTGFIVTVFEDESSATTSTTLNIALSNGTIAYTTTTAAQSWTVNWTSAVNSTRYFLTATITHSVYGTLTYRVVLPEEGGTTTPFSLDWLGDFSVETSTLIPALIILFVAGCFSALNAEVGAVLTCIMAIILTWLGWIPIPAGALVAATFFSILMALVYNKRRVTVY